jgi:glycosyltransferase involved in cell wall biosynthesis
MILKDPRLLIAVNTGEFFLSHRLHLAKGAKDAGFEVFVLCPPGPAIAKIEGLGFKVVLVEMGRKSMNPFHELVTISKFYKAIESVRPDVYHGFTIKPVLYGTIASLLYGVPKIVNTITGLGYLFISEALHVRMIRTGIGLVYRFIFASERVRITFQNEDDQNLFVGNGWVAKEKTRVIKGTGVDITRFAPSPEVSGVPVILFPARLLLDKGVRELIQAAETLKQKGYNFTVELCGKEDPGNPSALSGEELKEIREKFPYIKIRGHVEDMAEAFKHCHVVCLPSYREGIPLALIEASAAGKAMVTTDVPGCRAVVNDGVNGFLVKSKDSVTLADALEKLLSSSELRERFGAAARRNAISEFAKDSVIAKNLEVYEMPLVPRVKSA